MQLNPSLPYTPFWFFGERKGFKLESVAKVSEVEETLGIKYWLVFFKDYQHVLTFTSSHCCFGERDRLVCAMERLRVEQLQLKLEQELNQLNEDYSLELMNDWFTARKY